MPILLVAPALALVLTLIVGVGRLGWSSLHEYDTFLGLEGAVSTTQYLDVFADPQFKVVLVRSLAMASLTAAIAVALAIPFSLSMARASRRVVRLLLMVTIFIPFLTGDITRTFGWLVILGSNGPLARVYDQFGAEPPNLIGTLWAIGLGALQVLVPIAVVILLPSALRLDPELEHAASTLGARRYQTFFRITLPQLRVPCFGALAACWALAMGDFANPQILGQGIRDYVANFLQNRYLVIGNVPLGAATGIILLVTVTVGTALVLGLGRLRWRRSTP